MDTEAGSIPASERVALLRNGITIVEIGMADGRLVVAGGDEDRVRRLVARRLGSAVTVEVLDTLPRQLVPRPCVGHMEREPGRLQLRFVYSDDEHVDDVVVEEDEQTVVVLCILSTSVGSVPGPRCEGPVHVYLERPLGDRAVIDGLTGEPVPFKNVYADLAR
jgi:hypothetical protein